MARVIVLLHGATTLDELAVTATFGFVYPKNVSPIFCLVIES
jgi:hypothetical protein